MRRTPKAGLRCCWHEIRRLLAVCPLERLKAFVASGEPVRLCEKNLRQGSSRREVPPATLLYVPGQAAKIMSKDLAVAGIPEQTASGKLDFHALRTAFVNLVEYGQVSPKEAQDLARHSTPDLTFNVYGRSSIPY